MATVDVEPRPAEPATNGKEAPAVPDYLASPNAVFADEGVEWRYGKAPDYSKTRKVWEEGRKMNHAAGSLPQLVENLVKNWEVEASFKPRLQDWRTIDHKSYTFAINGGPPQSAEHMLKVGTYNAIITPNEYYSPENSDFASSHKTFKRMMPTFAWEVIEVYSGPPKVSFKWRHWGVMKNDYVGFNDKGEKIVAKAHGGPIEIYGVTVAQVDDKVRLQSIDTWFDPLEMFRQIAPHGIVNKEIMNRKADPETALDLNTHDEPTQYAGVKIADEHNYHDDDEHKKEPAPREILPENISNGTGQPADSFVPHQGADTEKSAPVANGTPTETRKGEEPAQSVLAAAASHGPTADTEKSDSKFEDAVEQQKDISNQPGQTSNKLPHVMQSRHDVAEKAEGQLPDISDSMNTSAITSDVNNVVDAISSSHHVDESHDTGTHDAVDQHLEGLVQEVHPRSKEMEEAVHPAAGEAIAVPAQSEETRVTHEEMRNVTPAECPFLMNRE